MKTRFIPRIVMILLCLGISMSCNTNNPDSQAASLSFAGSLAPAETADLRDHTADTAPETIVYMCDSKGAKKYHLTNSCRGLSPCKSEIVKIEKKDAEGRGLGLCGWED